MMLRTAIACTISAALALPVAAQGTGSEGYFEIFNFTDGHVLIGFCTNDGSGWSDNWIEGIEITPGEHATGEFHAESRPCDQLIVAGWLGEDGGEILDDPIGINICDASNIYLSDNEILYD